MLVVIANDLPPAVRGRMETLVCRAQAQRFCLRRQGCGSKNVVAYPYEHCPPESGVMIFCQQNGTGYQILGMGDTKRTLSTSGLQLVKEKTTGAITSKFEQHNLLFGLWFFHNLLVSSTPVS